MLDCQTLLFNINNFSVTKNTGNQAVSLRSFSLFRSAAPVSRASFRSTDTSQHKKTQQLKKKQLYFFCCSFLIFTRSLPFVRQGLCIHNTASFRYTPQATFLCIPAVLCLPPFIFSAVAPSHSHQGWHRSVKTSLCPKSRYAKRLTYILSLPLHATILSLHFAKASFRFQSSVAVRLPQHRQLRSSFITLKFRYRYI